MTSTNKRFIKESGSVCARARACVSSSRKPSSVGVCDFLDGCILLKRKQFGKPVIINLMSTHARAYLTVVNWVRTASILVQCGLGSCTWLCQILTGHRACFSFLFFGRLCGPADACTAARAPAGGAISLVMTCTTAVAVGESSFKV